MIELKNISKTYRMGSIDVQALKSVSLKIEQGEFVSIMGPSGSGKSTLLHILGFLDRPDSGTYLLLGEDVSKLKDDSLAVLRNNVAGFVFQQFYLLPRLSAADNVSLPLIYAGSKDLKARSEQKLESVGLKDRVKHNPSELSGGQQQRVAIARALVNEPLIIFADEPTGNLDLKSKDEIMGILKKLNDDGKTVIMVTHEPEIAAQTKRIIRVSDGNIVSDERKDQPAGQPVVEKTVKSLFQKKKSNIISELLHDHIPQAFTSMITHKMRSMLSMLGILIGVGAVIAMMAIGTGAQKSIADRLASLGSNLLMVMPGSQNSRGVALAAGTVTRFTVEDVAAISLLPDVRHVSGNANGRAQVVYGGKNWNTSVQGTGVDYPDIHAAKPAYGRFFTADEVKKREKVAIIGATVIKNIYGSANPIGTVMKINRVNFVVIGVLPVKGSSGFRDEDDAVVIPVSTAMYRLLGKQFVDNIDVEATDMDKMDSVSAGISNVIIKRHQLSGSKLDSFSIRNMADMQAALKSTTNTMSLLLGFIAAISLVVGGIGIMNIMLVSVTERTKEIGLRKAIGAQRMDILLQFLIESIVMTSFGGIIGIIMGAGTAIIVSTITGWVVIISPISVILAVGFSILIGVSFGFFPAVRASQLNPIEALRFE